MKTFKPVRTAMIGCGMISRTYPENCVKRFNVLDVAGVSDIVPERSGCVVAEQDPCDGDEFGAVRVSLDNLNRPGAYRPPGGDPPEGGSVFSGRRPSVHPKKTPPSVPDGGVFLRYSLPFSV